MYFLVCDVGQIHVSLSQLRSSDNTRIHQINHYLSLLIHIVTMNILDASGGKLRLQKLRGGMTLQIAPKITE